MYVCDDYCATTHYYDPLGIKEIVVSEWFVFPVAEDDNDVEKAQDAWCIANTAMDSMVLRYILDNADCDKLPVPCSSLDHSLILSKIQRFVKRRCHDVCLTNDHVRCVKIGDVTVTSVDARSIYGIIVTCVSTNVRGVGQRESEMRAKFVLAFREGFLKYMDEKLFHPTTVVSHVRTLTSKRRSRCTDYSKREYKIVSHALLYSMECTVSSVSRLKTIHVPNTAFLCDLPFLETVVLTKTNHQDMYRKRFEVLEDGHVLVSTFSRRPRIKWTGCVATCSPICDVVVFKPTAAERKLNGRLPKKYHRFERELVHFSEGCYDDCNADSMCGPALYKTKTTLPFVSAYQFVDDIAIAPRRRANSVSAMTKAYYFFKDRSHCSEITVYKVPRHLRSVLASHSRCVDVGHTTLDAFVKMSVLRQRGEVDLTVDVYTWEDKQLVRNSKLSENMNRGSASPTNQPPLKIVVMCDSQPSKHLQRCSVRYVLEGVGDDVLMGGIRLDCVAYPIRYGSDNWYDGKRIVNYVYAQKVNSEHAFLSVSVVHYRRQEEPPDYGTYEELVARRMSKTAAASHIGPALPYTRNFVVNAVRHDSSQLALGLNTEHMPLVVSVVSFECIVYLVTVCIKSASNAREEELRLPIQQAYFKILSHDEDGGDPRNSAVIRYLKRRLDTIGLYNTSFPINKNRRR